ERDRDRVVAGEDDEAVRDAFEHDRHLRNASRGFLDADDVVDFGEALHGGRLDVDAGAAGNVVKDDRQRNGCGDRFVVLVQALLRGLVVIRADGEDSGRAERFVVACALDDFGGVVAAGAGNDAHPAARLFDRDLDDAVELRVRERRAFARGAAGHEEIDAGVDLALDETAQRLLIEGLVPPKRSDQRRAASGKHLRVSFVYLSAALKAAALHLNLYSRSFAISRKSKKPFLPTTHRAARKAPRAKPSRLRAVCRIVIVSAAESKPISCVPGTVPARLLLVSMRLS